MDKNVIGLFDDFAKAETAVNELVEGGFARDDISLVRADDKGKVERTGDDATNGAAAGAGAGAVLGGLGGLLVGLGALTIPGIGPILAAGPLAAALAGAGVGAAAGGILGALVDLGVPQKDAEFYAEAVRRGGTLVTVRTTDVDNLADRAANILNRNGAVNTRERAEEWRSSGWTGFGSAETIRQDGLSAASGAAIAGTTPSAGNPTPPPVNVGYPEAGRAAARTGDWVPERDRDVTAPSDVPAAQPGAHNIGIDTMSATTAATGASTVHDTGRGNTFDTYAGDFRDNYDSNYALSGYPYDQYEPAYRYGYDIANDRRYRGRNWSVIEPDLRRDWESRGYGPWDRFKDAVRYAWTRVTGT